MFLALCHVKRTVTKDFEATAAGRQPSGLRLTNQNTTDQGLHIASCYNNAYTEPLPQDFPEVGPFTTEA